MQKLDSIGRFRGFQSPNTTPVPDEVFDELLAVLSGAEIKVLLYICRRTFGWKKESDNISLNQMLHGITRRDGTQLDRGAGLSKPTLLRSIKSLAQKNIVIAEQRESREKGHEPTNYRLNISESSAPLGKKMSQGGSQNFTKPLVKKCTSQETSIQETRYNTVNGNKSVFKNLPNLTQPKEKTEYVAERITEEFGDRKSLKFYRFIAAKVPEDVIYQAVSEAKQEGDNPAKLFTHKMKLYAVSRQKVNIAGG